VIGRVVRDREIVQRRCGKARRGLRPIRRQGRRNAGHPQGALRTGEESAVVASRARVKHDRAAGGVVEIPIANGDCRLANRYRIAVRGPADDQRPVGKNKDADDVGGQRGTPALFDHIYTTTQGSPFTINVTAVDAFGRTNGSLSSVVVTPADPEIEITSVLPSPGTEGIQENLAGLLTSTSSTNTYVVTVDWGDSTSTVINLGAGTSQPFQASHLFLPSSSLYTITASVLASDGGTAISAPASITVNNVAPTVSVSALSPILEAGTTTLTGTVTDPGLTDTQTVVIDWGDGTQTTGITLGPNGSTVHALVDASGNVHRSRDGCVARGQARDEKRTTESSATAASTLGAATGSALRLGILDRQVLDRDRHRHLARAGKRADEETAKRACAIKRVIVALDGDVLLHRRQIGSERDVGSQGQWCRRWLRC